MDALANEPVKNSDVMNLLQLQASDEANGEMTNNLELFNAALASAESEATATAPTSDEALLDQQAGDEEVPTFEINGEKHVYVQNSEDPETGEQLVILKNESGEHIALPSTVLAQSFGIAQEPTDALPEGVGILDATTDNSLVAQQEPQEGQEQQLSQEPQQPESEAPSQEHQPEQPVAEPAVTPVLTNGLPEAQEEQPQPENSEAQSEDVPKPVAEPNQPAAEPSAEIAPEGTLNTADIQVAAETGFVATTGAVFDGDAASLEALVANAMASSAAGSDFVIMTDERQADEAITQAVVDGAAAVEAADGQIYSIEAEEEDGSNQYVASDTASTEEMILQAMSQSGSLTDGQIIHAVVDDKTYAYTIQQTEAGFQLVPMGPVSGPSSPRMSPKKGSPTRTPKQRPVSGETLLVSSAPTMSSTPSFQQRKKLPAKPVSKTPISYIDNARFMGKPVPEDSLLNIPGPSQLASSRITYSKKNVVWCNPEQQKTKTSFSLASAVKNATRNETPITNVTNKVQPVPTQAVEKAAARPTPVKATSSYVKPVSSARSASPTKTPPASVSKNSIVVARENPIIIDDGKSSQSSIGRSISPAKDVKGAAPAKEAPVAPKETKSSAASKEQPITSKKENGIKSVTPEPTMDTSTRRSGRRSIAKVVEEPETQPEVKEKEPPKKKAAIEAVEPPTKIIEETVAPVVTESRPSRSRGRPSKGAVAETKTPAKAEIVEELKKEEITPAKIEEKKKVEIVESVKKTETKKSEKKEAEKKEPEVTPNDDASVRRSGRVVKRKSVDGEEVEKATPVVEKKTKTKEEAKVESVKNVNEDSATPRKRVGFAATTKEEEEPAVTSKRKKTPAPVVHRDTPRPSSGSVKPILKRTPNSTPRGRRLDKPIVAVYSSRDEVAEKRALLNVIDTLNDNRSPDQKYDDGINSACKIHVRHQSATLTSYSPQGSGASYACQKCGFRTSRMNILVLHHKDQCPTVKNAQINYWKDQIMKQTKTPPVTSTVTRRASELSSSSPEEDESNSPISYLTSHDPPTASKPDADAPISADEEDVAINLEKVIRAKYGFAAKDIVWAEWNKTNWPAFAMSVDGVKGIVHVKLIDAPSAPRRGLKLSVDKVAPFDDAEQNKKLLRDGREKENGELLVKAVQKAEEILRKQCLGESTMVKVLGDLEADYSDEHSDDEREALTRNNNHSPTNVDEEEETSFANAQTMDQWKERRKVHNAKLLQCVKEGKVENHLLGIYNGQIASERHQRFENGNEGEKVAWFGPIDDEEQQDEVYEYCSQLFKSHFKPDAAFDSVAYLFEVWVPEAITKAISRVRRLEMKEAEEVFQRGVVLSKSEKEEIRRETEKQTNPSGTNSSPEMTAL